MFGQKFGRGEERVAGRRERRQEKSPSYSLSLAKLCSGGPSSLQVRL